jgi:hypothetical protein
MIGFGQISDDRLNVAGDIAVRVGAGFVVGDTISFSSKSSATIPANENRKEIVFRASRNNRSPIFLGERSGNAMPIYESESFVISSQAEIGLFADGSSSNVLYMYYFEVLR